jgi:glycosyltransferase involved in cell wall biosynthesis
MLGECLDSINRQTYPNIEIVVVNDAGQDVYDIVSMRNSRYIIRYVGHPVNKGLAAARNSGIRACHGKYIAYLDDDDIFYPEHVETLVGVLEKGSHKVAYTDAFRAFQRKVYDEYVVEKRDVPYSFDFDRDRILISNYLPVICVMHDRLCMEKSGYFDESLATHEDWDLWIRMSRTYDFKHIPGTTCEFRWRFDDTSMTNERRDDFLRTIRLIHDRYREYVQGKQNIIREQTLFIRRHARILKIHGYITSMNRISGGRLLWIRRFLK